MFASFKLKKNKRKNKHPPKQTMLFLKIMPFLSKAKTDRDLVWQFLKTHFINFNANTKSQRRIQLGLLYL